ncbi:MAG TPA: CHRD domain-containing protein [Steroidobacteraceae bacterium]|nr:CHRD domain-containing protein [Steroidobacteraceae bacterium]
MTSTLRRTTAVAASVLLAVGVGLASAATIHLRLTGSQEVPSVKTMARGSGVVDVASNGKVSGRITTRGIQGTMAHIHEAAPGKNGPPILALKRGAKGTWVVPAGSKLSAREYKAFLAGDLYVNVHSAAHPGGEIRGQLRPEGKHRR